MRMCILSLDFWYFGVSTGGVTGWSSQVRDMLPLLIRIKTFAFFTVLNMFAQIQIWYIILDTKQKSEAGTECEKSFNVDCFPFIDFW